jgi:hypothetical protein
MVLGSPSSGSVVVAMLVRDAMARFSMYVDSMHVAFSTLSNLSNLSFLTWPRRNHDEGRVIRFREDVGWWAMAWWTALGVGRGR